MAADHNFQTAWGMLSILGPLCFTGIVLGLAGIIAYHRQVVRTRELSAELVQQMLQRKMSVEEIERVLRAWSPDSDTEKTLTRAGKVLAHS